MSWDGKMYDKYRIEHTDGTPLKGKRYFVLRLDSDDPVEAARVAAAMRAYKNESRQCDVGTAEEQYGRFWEMCSVKDVNQCAYCEFRRPSNLNCSRDKCFAKWAQMPYEAKKEGGNYGSK